MTLPGCVRCIYLAFLHPTTGISHPCVFIHSVDIYSVSATRLGFLGFGDTAVSRTDTVPVQLRGWWVQGYYLSLGWQAVAGCSEST